LIQTRPAGAHFYVTLWLCCREKGGKKIHSPSYTVHKALYKFGGGYILVSSVHTHFSCTPMSKLYCCCRVYNTRPLAAGFPFQTVSIDSKMCVHIWVVEKRQEEAAEISFSDCLSLLSPNSKENWKRKILTLPHRSDLVSCAVTIARHLSDTL
jgi:hypothetical protein